MKFPGKLLAVAAVLLWTSQAIAQRPGGMMGTPSREDDRDGRSRDDFRGPGGGNRGEFRGRGGPRFGGDRGGPGGDDRGRGGPPIGGDRGPGDGSRGRGGPQFGGYRGRGGSGDDERAFRLEVMLRGFDANGNGLIEPGEVPEERKRMLGFMARRAGIEIDGPIRIEKIRDAMLGRGTRDGGESKKSSKEAEPLVAGFGTDEELAHVPGFGERVEGAAGSSSAGRSSYSSSRSSSSKDSSGRPSSSRSGSDREGEERIRNFAKSMMRRYDRDGSGVLEKHEWGQVRGDPNEIDLNHDGKITQDEMAKRLENYSRRRGGGDRSDSSRDGRSEKSRSSGLNNAKRPDSYRFATALELLPDGLPPWFAEQDASGDGQVSMAEYSSYWDDRKANEFVRLDLNGDGVITPRECLDAGSSPEPSAAPAGPPVGGPSPSGAPVTPKPKAPASAEKPWWE
jgi:EF hand domain-containing protein